MSQVSIILVLLLYSLLNNLMQVLFKETNITHKQRSILVEWIIEVISYYNLKPTTLIRTIRFIDFYLTQSPDIVSLQNFQLVGAASLLHNTARNDFPFKISQNNVNHSAIEEIASLFDGNVFEVCFYIFFD